jgi:hypothetical protein
MKNLSIFLAATAIIIGASSCKKTSSNGSISQWNYNGTNYQSSSTVFATEGSVSIIEANDVKDTVTNFVLVEFGSKPVNNEKFSVIDAMSGTLDSASCGIVTGSVDSTQVPNLLGQSAGSTIDSVTVTIVNGKYHVSFANVTMQEYSEIFTGVSGTLIQQ